LYSGTGTIGLFLAKHAAKVVGLEYVDMAVEDAKENAKINQIKNATFFAGDMKKLLTHEFIHLHGNPDVIITDPPRAGMDEEVVQQILHVKPKTIVYVSCNPATQARDLALLDALYTVDVVHPVDMFPQTHHVENIVRLRLKNKPCPTRSDRDFHPLTYHSILLYRIKIGFIFFLQLSKLCLF